MLRHGPAHPVCLTAVGLLLVNDHVLKSAFPSALTGKLSDFAWMVVCPVLIAAILSALRLPDRLARIVALSVAVLSFVLLQLYPPLGEAWIGVFGGAHVPDPTDLIALPAVLLAPLCWRPTTPRSYAAPLAFAACMATSYPEDIRDPCDGETDWDPNRPLLLSWGYSGAGVPVDTPSFTESVSLTGPDGAVPFAVAQGDWGVVLLCPLGGLAPETEYTWDIGEFADKSTNQATVPYFSHQGAWTFTTAAEAEWPLIEDAAGCLVDETADYRAGGGCWDTGAPDTGDTGGAR